MAYPTPVQAAPREPRETENPNLWEYSHNPNEYALTRPLSGRGIFDMRMGGGGYIYQSELGKITHYSGLRRIRFSDARDAPIATSPVLLAGLSARRCVTGGGVALLFIYGS
jgi:hypothetical protein